MKKQRSPYFVIAELLQDGMVRLVDDDGEVYHIEMRRECPWPLVSHQVRNREMRELADEIKKEKPAAPPIGPFRPTLIKS
jgi:hypothetical protein